VRNGILLRIPMAEFDVLKTHLEFVPFRIGTTLERQYAPIQSVYFINRGIVSKIVEMEDGKSVEVGIAGREHMTGLQLAVGLENMMHSLVVQVPGEGFRVAATTLKWALKSLPELTVILTRRLGIQSVQFERNAACNRFHGLKQRLARFLLLTFDRIESEVFHTTHDFLAIMVGCDRPSVSIALADLESGGTIRPQRGAISLVSRRKLEAQSCECYAVFRQFNAELGLR
jgi:CRP-like cAMP-binding protein